jgi:hypothetical protein
MTTSKLVELSLDMFNSKEDYLEFRKLYDELIQ